MRLLVALLALCCCTSAMAADFPRPPALEPAVDFWTRIYSQVDTSGGLLHDRDNLAVVYETLSFEEHLWHPSRERKITARRAHYRDILRTLAGGKREGLSAEEQRVLALWPEDVSNARLRHAANSIRFQLGQADRFRQGLIRSGAWEPHMRAILAEMDLPPGLAALPHVESSFNPDAWSRVGAAGIWQFTRLTGRRFMRVDHVVDQRMDPFAATRAAGRLLSHNYSVTGDWGLAVTAYNHGLAGIRRAARDVGSENIADIIKHYNGRNWGFASRNFYPSFLAAVEVDENARDYFGDLERHPPLVSETVELPFYTPVAAVLDAFEVDRETLRELNRGLREPVWSGRKHIPRGYELRLPVRSDRPALQERLARIDSEQRYFSQVPDREHTVQRGESLSGIAARYDTSVRDLMAMNNLRSAHRIRAGQTLRLPVDGATPIAGDTYTVEKGDTLSGIAHRAGMSVKALAAANGIDPEKAIQPGDTLRVDGKPADGVATIAAADTGDEQTGDITVDSPVIPDSDDTAGTDTDTGTAPFEGDPVAAISRHISDLVRPDAEPAGLAPTRIPLTRGEPVELAGTGHEGPADLSADPSDYSVADNNSIRIQAAETLGHYAEWLDIRAADLRRLNGMRYGTPLIIGERLKLDFSEVEPATFEQRRRQYHGDLQAAFFEKHHITDERVHTVERGDSLWTLTRPNTEIPVWLLRQYNPDMDFTRLHPGTEIRLPVISIQE